MRISELLRLVIINLSQNKFKVILTSVGIIVGSATIMMVLAIGTGGKLEVAEQFKNLNAGAIDISYESNAISFEGGRNRNGGGGGMPSGGRMPAGGGNRGGGAGGFGGGMPQGGPGGGMLPGGMGEGFGGGFGRDNDRMNMEKIVLSTDDMEDLEVFVPDISDVTISYTTTSEVEGGELEEAGSYTIAGVKSNYMEISNLSMIIGEFLSSENDENKEKYCVLGYSTAKEIFGSVYSGYGDVVYIDARPYVVSGVLEEMGSVSSGISPDTAIFIPYDTGVKYITGQDISPTITVIAADVNNVDTVIENIETVLADSYANAEFTISDAGTKMEAASKSNDTLQLLLVAMAAIVFVVGGIGIMNVLFVSVKERTNEIGILKALGCSKRDILLEFLFEACFMSFIGAILGVLAALGVTPIIEGFSVRVELSVSGALLSLAFGVITGSIFGFYPAYKASSLIPVVALNQE
ncbi:MAG: FtsX-like permease family protein [Lachnospiraceae bacterium]|nr:FtsX-like permease family protein [Lachnospiraceae bacterium]